MNHHYVYFFSNLKVNILVDLVDVIFIKEKDKMEFYIVIKGNT